MKLTLVLISCLISFVVAASISKTNKKGESGNITWQYFKEIHHKKYVTPEIEEKHRKIFEKTCEDVKKHNELYKKGEVSFKRSINKFSDMSQEQFQMLNNGLLSNDIEPNTEKAPNITAELRVSIPNSFDWRDHGVRTPIKDQGESCASCWSFAATGAIEAHAKIHFRRNLDLSEQNLIDCAKSYYDLGCFGGHPLHAFNYTRENRGMSLRMYYPYESVKGDKCRYKEVFNSGAFATGYKRLPKGDEDFLKRTIAQVGPVVAAIDGTLSSLREYSSGIYYDKDCNSTRLTHAVLIVGYGSENGEDYWIIKNSYSKYWGEKGYFRLARNKNNHCGIAEDTSYPIVYSDPNHRF